MATRGEALLRKRCGVDSPKPAVDLEDAAVVSHRSVSCASFALSPSWSSLAMHFCSKICSVGGLFELRGAAGSAPACGCTWQGVCEMDVAAFELDALVWFPCVVVVPLQVRELFALFLGSGSPGAPVTDATVAPAGPALQVSCFFHQVSNTLFDFTDSPEPRGIPPSCEVGSS